MIDFFLKILRILFGVQDLDQAQVPPIKNSTVSPPKTPTEPVKQSQTYTIVVDPGHGGEDPGTVYRDDETGELTAEKDAALKISLTLKYLLTKMGWKVYLTRVDDKRPSYSHRTSLPSSVEADVFISIHFNMPKSYGLVYYAAEKDRPSSKRLAEVIDKHMKFNKIWPSTASRFGRLYIDNVRYDIPSVLVEIDSIDDYQDSKAYRIKKAKEIVDALVEFFEEGE